MMSLLTTGSGYYYKGSMVKADTVMGHPDGSVGEVLAAKPGGLSWIIQNPHG